MPLASRRYTIRRQVFKLTVTLSPDTEMDPRLILGSAILIAAIEGRQG